MLTEKQKEAREMALGSSDAPIVAGVSPYKSPLELYFQLHGELPRYTDEESQAQRIGSKLEPMIAELVAEDLGLKIRRMGTQRHKTHAFMVASLDFEIINNPKGPGVLEIKNRMGMRPFETVPDDIMLQVVQQMAVTNREWAIVGVLFQFGKMQTYEVRRDKELEEYLIELEGRFMLRVQRSEPPDHTWTPETVGILKKLYPKDSGVTLELPAELGFHVDAFMKAKQELAAAEGKKAEFEGTLKSAMGAASLATIPGYTLSWKSTRDGKKFDVEKFEEEYPEMFQYFQTTRPGHRVFKVTQSKEVAR